MYSAHAPPRADLASADKARARAYRNKLRFNDLTIDLDSRVLRADGECIALEPKVFDCLAYLVEHRHRAVGRDELIAAVWGKVDVSDAMLGQAVLKARRAVRDTGKRQAVIRTVARFGYQWVAATDVVAGTIRPISRPAVEIPEIPIDRDRPEAASEDSRDASRSYLVSASFGLAAAVIVMILFVLISNA